MNTAEFAAGQGVSEQIARRWFRSGRLPGVKRDARGRWVITDPKAAAAAWRRNFDSSKVSLPELERAIESGRAADVLTRKPAAPPVPAPAADRPLAAACDEMTAAFMIDLWLKVTGLDGFDELDEMDQRELRSVFSTALDGMVLYGVPVAEASSWPPAFDPAYVAEVCRVD